jgi:hypothetical protein
MNSCRHIIRGCGADIQCIMSWRQHTNDSSQWTRIDHEPAPLRIPHRAQYIRENAQILQVFSLFFYECFVLFRTIAGAQLWLLCHVLKILCKFERGGRRIQHCSKSTGGSVTVPFLTGGSLRPNQAPTQSPVDEACDPSLRKALSYN